MSVVTKRVEGGKVRVRSPYHEGFIRRARALGGKFNRSAVAWDFSEKVWDAVRSVLMQIYGEDGELEVERADVVVSRTDGGEYRTDGSLFLLGRVVLEVRSRDSGARPTSGCAVLNGKTDSRGSRRNPVAWLSADTHILIEGVPVSLIDVTRSDGWTVERQDVAEDDHFEWVAAPSPDGGACFATLGNRHPVSVNIYRQASGWIGEVFFLNYATGGHDEVSDMGPFELSPDLSDSEAMAEAERIAREYAASHPVDVALLRGERERLLERAAQFAILIEKYS